MVSEKQKQVFEFRAFPDGEDRFFEFMEKDFMAIGWPEIGDVSDQSPEAINHALETEYGIVAANTRGQYTGFFTRLKKNGRRKYHLNAICW